MIQGKKILALIPARSGSKGIPGKNIKPLCGKPLIAYSILAATQSAYIDDVIVSTDSEEIKVLALEYGANVPFLRPAHLASDTAKTIDAMLYTLRTLKEQGISYDYIVLLQPTQPFRKAAFIDEAILSLIESPFSSLVSVTSANEHPILMRTLKEDGTLQSLLSMSSTVRRQDFPPVYRVNGSIYINQIDKNFNEDTSLNDNVLPYFMEQAYSIDIDTLEDFNKAEAQGKLLCF